MPALLAAAGVSRSGTAPTAESRAPNAAGRGGAGARSRGLTSPWLRGGGDRGSTAHLQWGRRGRARGAALPMRTGSAGGGGPGADWVLRSGRCGRRGIPGSTYPGLLSADAGRLPPLPQLWCVRGEGPSDPASRPGSGA